MRKVNMGSGPYKDSDGRMHIPPSGLGRCLKALQLEQQGAPEQRGPYYMYKGGYVHDVVEELIKSLNPTNIKAWHKVRSRQRYIPWEWRLPLNVSIPKFEDTFRDYLLNTKFGKRLKSSSVWIESKIEIPLEDLKLKLPFTAEEIKLFKAVGKPDCYFSNMILEFKTGKIEKNAFLQGLLYEKMAKLYYKNPRTKNRIVKIGPRHVKLAMMSKFWTPGGKFRQKKEDDLLVELTNMITHFLKWDRDPNYQMPKKVTRSCYSCKYYKVCMSPVARMFRSIVYKVRREFKRVKKPIKMILRNSNKKNEKKSKSIRIPTLTAPKKI